MQSIFAAGLAIAHSFKKRASTIFSSSTEPVSAATTPERTPRYFQDSTPFLFAEDDPFADRSTIHSRVSKGRSRRDARMSRQTGSSGLTRNTKTSKDTRDTKVSKLTTSSDSSIGSSFKTASTGTIASTITYGDVSQHTGYILHQSISIHSFEAMTEEEIKQAQSNTSIHTLSDALDMLLDDNDASVVLNHIHISANSEHILSLIEAF